MDPAGSPRAALARRAAVCRDMLEEALLDLPRLSHRVDRRPVVSLLEQALAQVAQIARAPDLDAAMLDLAGAAAATVTGASAMLAITASDEAGRAARRRLQSAARAIEALRREALDEIVAEQARVKDAPHKAPADPPRPLRASRGVPLVHAIEREPLSPAVRVEAPPPPPPPPPRLPAAGRGEDEIEEPDDDDDTPPAPPRGAPRYDPAAVHPVSQLRRLAIDCFEELGTMGCLREPTEDAPWSPELSRFEDRLLANLDAAVALGRPVIFGNEPRLRLDVLRELIAWADDAFVADPNRAFARAFILGCVEGDDAIRAAVTALRQSSPYVRKAQASALSLASSPAVAPAMEALAWGDDPALAAFALDVLRDRREVSLAAAVGLLSHPAAGVRRSAALCLGAARERSAAGALLSSALPVEADDGAAAAAAKSLVRLGSREGLSFARRRLREAGASTDPAARADLLRILAVAGGPEDLETMIAAASSAPGAVVEAEVAAVGWYGHPGCVAPLIDTLDRACAALAAWSTREVITGSIRRIVGIEVEPSSAGARAFRASWEKDRARFWPSEDAGERRRAPPRLRFGAPWSPLASLDELAKATLPASDRDLLALEIAVVSAGALRLDVRGWVARQLGEIEAAREALGTPGAAFQPGEWPHGHLK